MEAKTTSVVHHGHTLLGIATLSGVLAAEEISQPLFRTIDLDIGETQEFKLADGTAARVKLVGLTETRDRVRDAVRRAEVKVEVKGSVTNLVSAAFHLPVTVSGVQLDCPITKGDYQNRDR